MQDTWWNDSSRGSWFSHPKPQTEWAGIVCSIVDAACSEGGWKHTPLGYHTHWPLQCLVSISLLQRSADYAIGILIKFCSLLSHPRTHRDPGRSENAPNGSLVALCLSLRSFALSYPVVVVHHLVRPTPKPGCSFLVSVLPGSLPGIGVPPALPPAVEW